MKAALPGMDCRTLISPSALSVLSYSLCSGSLLLLNKMVLRRIPNTPAVTIIQLTSCVTAILISQLLGVVKLEKLSMVTVKVFLLYGVLFAWGVYTNMRALQVSNVDTVIVFRACVPLCVSAADYLWLGRELPSMRSFLAMLIVGIGAISYVSIDSAFALKGFGAYGWVSMYFVAITAEMILGKVITSSVKVQLAMQVFLTNAIGAPLMMGLGLATGELSKFHWDMINMSNLPLLVVSCIVGAGIGFSGWWCRSLVSATSFTVIGILNKLLTVLLNIAVWDNHASWLGTLCLLGCLAGGSFYQQAPLREAPASPKPAPKPAPMEEVKVEPVAAEEAVTEVSSTVETDSLLTGRTRAANGNA